EAALVQTLAEHLLAMEGFAVDEFEDDGLTARFHGPEGTSEYTVSEETVHDYASIVVEFTAREVYKYSF
ncbi:MAG: hypothetical protein HY047_06990, partial [Acidobacteria bacterium]|nr:hypothetical protein [Acidobacteriota bacterium]